MRDSDLFPFLHVTFLVAAMAMALIGCQLGSATPTLGVTPTVRGGTPTPTPFPTFTPAEQSLFHTYAHGELLPDMRVPIQRSATGEGGWYVIIGTEEGWAQFLSQMGQPTEIWEPVQWDKEILVGALLGVRDGRGYGITIGDLTLGGVEVRTTISFATPSPDQTASPWITYPFHLIRVPRIELPMGPVTFRFANARGQAFASQVSDVSEVDIVWLPGPGATYPTPTPILPTPTPGPTATPTPVPNLRVLGVVLNVSLDAQTLRIVPAEGNWEYVDLMEGTSILSEDSQPISLAQLKPGMTIGVLGYPGEERTIWAAHIDVLNLPTEEEGFATYQPRSVTLSTIYDGYTLPLSPEDISVTSPLTQTFSPTQTNVLTEAGFVVAPAAYKTFSSLYNDPQYVTYPVFISADSVLHVSQLLFDRVSRSVKGTHLAPELTMLDREMFTLSWDQYEAALSLNTPQGERFASAARRNAAYFAVALSLLDPDFTPPDLIAPTVNAELSLITATTGLAISPLFDILDVPDEEKVQVDYAQFAPDEHSIHDEEELRYFRAMTWHHLITWRLGQRKETRSAVLIAHILNTHPVPHILWQRVYDTLSFFQGQEATLTPADYGHLLAEVWGESPDIAALADDAKLDEFIAAARALPLPDNTMWVWIWRAEGRTDRDLSFLGQPFQVDGYIFQQTTGGYVSSPENGRRLPSGVHLAAVLGSLEAYDIASQVGDGASPHYLDKVRNELAALRDAHWTADLHWNWLYIYRPLLQDKSPSYPAWMRTTAWKRKELQTMLGSWIDVRHDTDPAVELVEQPGDKGSTIPLWGYVEPQPEVYARLATLTQMIVEGLDSRLMLHDAERALLSEWQTWLVLFQDVARRELTGQPLTDLEVQRLAGYGPLIEELTLAAMNGQIETGDQALQAEYEASAAISVATAQDVQRIEAIGRVDEIYVVIERGRKQFLARGGVYSHYEFEWPAQDLLTDPLWQQMLADGQAPPRPTWASFVQE